MARAGLKHWMLHNDQLAHELDETLKLSPGYDPVRDVDPALTFHAPLLTGPDSIPGAIRAVIERNSEATYKAPRGAFLLSALDDESRHEYTADDEPLGVLMEPASTNKCTNYNANPDAALSNINQIGDPAAIFSRVQDVEELAAAGLTAVCKSGFVLKLDNSAGSSGAEIQFQGATGNLNDHVIVAYARIDPASTGVVEVKPTGQNGVDVTTTNYERILVPFTPTETSREAAFNCQAGGVGYVILNHLEESPVPTSVIVTEGAATSRAVDQISWPLAGEPKGPQKLANNEFENWADPTYPDDWTLLSVSDPNNYVAEDPENTLRLVSDGTYVAIAQDVLEPNIFYEYRIDIQELTGTLGLAFGSTQIGINQAGISTDIVEQPSGSQRFEIKRFDGPVDARVNSMHVRPLTPILNQSEGMVALVWRPSFDGADAPAGAQRILTAPTDGTDTLIFFYEKTAVPNESFRFLDGVGASSDVALSESLQAGSDYLLLFHWGPAIRQIGYKKGGTVAWGAEGAAPTWNIQDVIELFASLGLRFPSHNRGLYFWTINRGRAWLESFFEGVAN